MSPDAIVFWVHQGAMIGGLIAVAVYVRVKLEQLHREVSDCIDALERAVDEDKPRQADRPRTVVEEWEPDGAKPADLPVARVVRR
jgi:hypothetical protein